MNRINKRKGKKFKVGDLVRVDGTNGNYIVFKTMRKGLVLIIEYGYTFKPDNARLYHENQLYLKD